MPNPSSTSNQFRNQSGQKNVTPTPALNSKVEEQEDLERTARGNWDDDEDQLQDESLNRVEGGNYGRPTQAHAAQLGDEGGAGMSSFAGGNSEKLKASDSDLRDEELEDEDMDDDDIDDADFNDDDDVDNERRSN